MATNNFKPFATGAGANAMSQAEWEALPALLTGFQSGKASSAQVNKALRQGTVMASMLGKFIVDSSGKDALDDGNINTLESAFTEAVKGRLINVRTFTSSGTYTPTTGTKSIVVECQGGGGGGGSAIATSTSTRTLTVSGGAGGYAKSLITSILSSYAVTVGAGGASDASGGATTFGSIVAGGGNPGTLISGSLPASANSLGLGATGGTATGGNIINSTGGNAQFSMMVSGAAITGLGGDSCLGKGGRGAGASEAVGGNGELGSGGGGANAAGKTTTYLGGSGGKGIVIIWEYA